MRAVYRLLGLVRRYGAEPVETACSRALDLDVVSVTKVASMLERATEGTVPLLPVARAARASRFARDPGEYAARPAPRGPTSGETSPASTGTGPATAWTALASEGTTTLAGGGTATPAGGGTAGGGTATLTLIRGDETVVTFDATELEEDR